MNHNVVFCRRLERELPALENAPFASSLGQIIQKNVSAMAFAEWLELQIKIINEERLDLSEEAAQLHLYEQMINYLNLKDLVE